MKTPKTTRPVVPVSPKTSQRRPAVQPETGVAGTKEGWGPKRGGAPGKAPSTTLKEKLADAVVGQDGPIALLASLEQSIRTGHPVVIEGPPGVGKTMAAELAARALWGDSVVTVDASRLRTPVDLNSLFGSPAGFVGHGGSGLLAAKKGVVVDEIDAADPQVAKDVLKTLKQRGIAAIATANRAVEGLDAPVVRFAPLAEKDAARLVDSMLKSGAWGGAAVGQKVTASPDAVDLLAKVGWGLGGPIPINRVKRLVSEVLSSMLRQLGPGEYSITVDKEASPTDELPLKVSRKPT